MSNTQTHICMAEEFLNNLGELIEQAGDLI